jgi:asparagine synthase (glutamine-hydrolysing)
MINPIHALSIYKKKHLIKSIISQKLSYLEPEQLTRIFDIVNIIEDKSIPGVLIETGCALGGSAIVIASSKSRQRKFYVYDVFDMIPPPSNNDGDDVHDRYKIITEGKSVGINGETYYGYVDSLIDVVTENFRKFNLDIHANNISLIKGLYEDTLQINAPVAFAHIDCDWYESVMTCLTEIVPFLSKDGILVIDDYYAWSGCKKAVDEYFTDKRSDFKFENKYRLEITKL